MPRTNRLNPPKVHQTPGYHHVTVLEAVDASPGDVVRSAIYVVSDESDLLSRVWFYLLDSLMGAAFTSLSTLLGVNQLGYSGQLVEVDLTVALPG